MSEEENSAENSEEPVADDWAAAMEEQTEAETSDADADWGDALQEQAEAEAVVENRRRQNFKSWLKKRPVAVVMM